MSDKAAIEAMADWLRGELRLARMRAERGAVELNQERAKLEKVFRRICGEF
jgi:hypothetical protein